MQLGHADALQFKFLQVRRTHRKDFLSLTILHPESVAGGIIVRIRQPAISCQGHDINTGRHA